MQYQIMHFGKKKKRISLIHMNKPLSSGVVGMVSSSLFADNIPIVIDDAPDDKKNYDFTCLAWSPNGTVPRIMMSREIYYDIKRGKPYARMILFHELGHYYHKDHLSQKGCQDEERALLTSKGVVSDNELRADFFAVDYLGVEIVTCGLDSLLNLIKCKYNEYDEEVDIVLKEIDIRRKAILQTYENNY